MIKKGLCIQFLRTLITFLFDYRSLIIPRSIDLYFIQIKKNQHLFKIHYSSRYICVNKWM